MLLLGLCISIIHGERVEKIQQCGAHCSQRLPCKGKPHFSLEQCRNLPHATNKHIFRNTSISTVMTCKEKQHCSLHLRVNTHLRINKYIQGVYVCVVSAGMMEHCRIVNFPRTAREKLVGKQVNIQDDCLQVGMGQEVQVTLQTWPQFCGYDFSQSYKVADCSHRDLQRNLAECITGRIDYKVDGVKKEVHVNVSDMLMDKDYNLRLCHKEFICTGTIAHSVIKKGNPVKKAILKYTRPLPCLCIEGWSIMPDAPRIQVCPFKKNVEELWSGAVFDPVQETLSWEAACKVTAVITLCELRDEGMCEDLANSTRKYNREKVIYSGVDPHPRLCMKFITEDRLWVKCPFSDGTFPAWDIEVSTQENHAQLILTSRVRTAFSLSTCEETETLVCEDKHSVLMNVENLKPLKTDLTMDLCGQNQCIKVKRLDVKFGIAALICQLPCTAASSKAMESKAVRSSKWQHMHVVVPAVALTSAVVIVAIVTVIAVLGWKIKWHKMKTLGVAHLSRQQTALFIPVTDESHSKSQLTSGTMLDDGYSSESPQLQHSERSNLLNDFKYHLEV